MDEKDKMFSKSDRQGNRQGSPEKGKTQGEPASKNQ
jgi:hypothetical protein